MKKTLSAGVLAALFVAGLAMQPVWADEERGYGKGHEGGYGSGHGCCGKHGYGMRGHHASTGHLIRGLLHSQKEMGLTDEQMAKLKAIHLDLDKARIKAEADIMIAERELDALVDNEKSDLSAIEAKVKESENLEAGLRVAAIKARRDVMDVLTPEQAQRVKTVHETMMHKSKEGKKGEGMGHGMMKGEHGGMSKGDGKKKDDKSEMKH
ncbi:MAG: periplasmic heavy metal sensor [Nitrospirota bacterium]